MDGQTFAYLFILFWLIPLGRAIYDAFFTKKGRAESLDDFKRQPLRAFLVHVATFGLVWLFAWMLTGLDIQGYWGFVLAAAALLLRAAIPRKD